MYTVDDYSQKDFNKNDYKEIGDLMDAQDIQNETNYGTIHDGETVDIDIVMSSLDDYAEIGLGEEGYKLIRQEDEEGNNILSVVDSEGIVQDSGDYTKEAAKDLISDYVGLGVQYKMEESKFTFPKLLEDLKRVVEAHEIEFEDYHFFKLYNNYRPSEVEKKNCANCTFAKFEGRDFVCTFIGNSRFPDREVKATYICDKFKKANKI